MKNLKELKDHRLVGLEGARVEITIRTIFKDSAGELYYDDVEHTFDAKKFYIYEQRGVGTLRDEAGDIIQLVPSDDYTLTIHATGKVDEPGTPLLGPA